MYFQTAPVVVKCEPVEEETSVPKTPPLPSIAVIPSQNNASSAWLRQYNSDKNLNRTVSHAKAAEPKKSVDLRPVSPVKVAAPAATEKVISSF